MDDRKSSSTNTPGSPRSPGGTPTAPSSPKSPAGTPGVPSSPSRLSKQTGNGRQLDQQEEDKLNERLADKRTNWQVFLQGLYNPTKHTVLGRTRKQWGIFGLFYLVFYSCLALLCAVCYMGFRTTLDDHTPKYTLGESIIGTNPGLAYRPESGTYSDEAEIKYVSSNSTQIKMWVERIDNFLEKYLDKTKLPNGGRDQVICDFNRPPGKGKSCAVDPSDWGPCSKAKSYGYAASSPCIFVKLNKIFDWVPDYYNDSSNLPDILPDDLKSTIKQIKNKAQLNTVWLSCDGEKSQDQEKVGQIDYYPSYRGFPGYYYPYVNTPEYLNPLVAIQFVRPARNVSINIECKAWAKNIEHKSYHGGKTGSIRFTLMVKE